MAIVKMEEIFDCIYTRPYADDDALLNDFVNDIVHRVSWEMFKDQEKVCHMISECNPPKLKDGALDHLTNIINKQLGWVRNYIICRILVAYRMSNVDLDEESEWYLREEFDDEGWKEFTDTMNRYIWDDYRKYMGDEGAKAYFTKINRPEFIFEEEDDK